MMIIFLQQTVIAPYTGDQTDINGEFKLKVYLVLIFQTTE